MRSFRSFLLIICFFCLLLLSMAAAIMTRREALRELGLMSKFSEKELKRAYRRRSLETHPDKGGSKEAFIRVAEAYELLSTAGGSSSHDYYNSSTRGNNNQQQQHQKPPPSFYEQQEMFQKAEDMFFDIFDEYFDKGKVVDMALDKIFGPNDRISSRMRRRIKGFIKFVVGHVIRLIDHALLHNNSDAVKFVVNGRTYRVSDFRQWKEKKLQERRRRRRNQQQRKKQ